MAKGRGNYQSVVTVSGQWLGMPFGFLSSRVCAELSPAALKLLLDLCSQLGSNTKGNGNLRASMTVMQDRGWTNKNALAAAVRELQTAGLLVVTLQGWRYRCSLYALTLWGRDEWA